MTFTSKNLIDTLDSRKKAFPILSEYQSVEILKHLWELGIIAQQNPGRKYEFVYERSNSTFSHIAERFRVHYGLKESLQLIQERS